MSETSLAAAIQARRGSRFVGDNKDVALYFERSKNANLVIFEVKKVPSPEHGGSKLAPSDTIDAYWLDLEPSYQAKKRAKGIESDREELNFIDRWQAYGCKVVDLQPHQAGVEFVALPKKVATLQLIKDGDSGDFVPITRMKINNVDNAVLERIYVKSDESGWIPSVVHIDVHGLHPETREPITERIQP